jgi:hypothetical protein
MYGFHLIRKTFNDVYSSLHGFLHYISGRIQEEITDRIHRAGKLTGPLETLFEIVNITLYKMYYLPTACLCIDEAISFL